MKNVIKTSLESLNQRGYTVRPHDIKKAYWRLAKHRGGINIGLDNQVYKITEYLIFNRIAKPAYKFQTQNNLMIT